MAPDASKKAAAALVAYIQSDGARIVARWTRLLKVAMPDFFMAMAPALWAERLTDTLQVLAGELAHPATLRYPVFGKRSGSAALRALGERTVAVHMSDELDLHEFESAYFLLQQAIIEELDAGVVAGGQPATHTLVDHFFKQLAVAMAQSATARNLHSLESQLVERAGRLERLRHQEEAFTEFLRAELTEALDAVSEAQARLRQALAPLPPKPARCLGLSEVQALRARTLLEEAVEFARLDAGSRRIAQDAVDVRQLTQRAVAPLAEAIADRALMLMSELPPDLPAVPGDAALLERAVRTILAHALWSAAPHTRLWLRARTEGPVVVVEVEDEESAPADVALTQFERPPDDGAYQLGLPMARLVAELHGGGLFVDMGEHGRRYRLMLPRLPRPSARPVS